MPGARLPSPLILLFYCLNPIVSYIEVTEMLKQTIYVCLYNFERKKKSQPQKTFSGSACPAGSSLFSEAQALMQGGEFVRMDQVLLSRIKPNDQRVCRLWNALTTSVVSFGHCCYILFTGSSNSQLLKGEVGNCWQPRSLSH